jgi:hypothetical protein
MSQPGRDRPDVLWCPHDAAAAHRQLELVSADERRIALTIGDVESADTVDTAHLLRFWPHDLDGVPEAESLAADYQQPATLSLSKGEQVRNAPGDLNNDGFNESQGCYELAPHEGLLRFRFVPGATLHHYPVFRIHRTAGRTCWIYVEGRIIRGQGRDGAGQLLFTIPRAVSTPLMIEVNTRRQTAAPAARN